MKIKNKWMRIVAGFIAIAMVITSIGFMMLMYF